MIITGRREDRLKLAAEKLDNISTIAADINNADDVNKIVEKVKAEFGGLDILINNAGHAHTYKLSDEDANSAVKAAEEMQTNYLSAINLSEKFLPLLKAAKEGAIVNVTSIVAFVPGLNIPTYSASKAALHSYSQILRYTLAKDTNVKVFELMPPLVNTDFSSSIGGENGIPPQQVANDLIEGFEKDVYEIHVGNTAGIYQLFLSSPQEALNILNQGR